MGPSHLVIQYLSPMSAALPPNKPEVLKGGWTPYQMGLLHFLLKVTWGASVLGGSLLPIDCIADCESERISALVNLVSWQHNWPKAILMTPISPSNADLFCPAAAKKLLQNVSLGMRSSFSHRIKAFSSTDERIVRFPVTRSIASMGVDFVPPVISHNAWLCVFSSGLRIASEAEFTQEYEFALAIILVVEILDEAVEGSPFGLFESSCPAFFFQHSTEGSVEVVVRPDKDDFSYWNFASGWS
nr:hypothetical transcript [Hymenolepis microstoma]